MLEIIAERKIAEHLKICAVARCFAHTLDIRRAYAFLACDDPFCGRGLKPQKIALHRRHSRVDEQQRVVVLRHERITRQPHMTLTLKKGQEFFSYIV